MEDPIFDKSELERLRTKQPKESLVDLVNKDTREEGLRKAIKRIKEDNRTHRALLDEFDEAEGFLLKFHYGTYLTKREEGRIEPPYLSLRSNLPSYADLILIAQRNKKNFIVAGNLSMLSYYNVDNSRVRPVKVYCADDNLQKRSRIFGSQELLNSENFALSLLLERTNVELNLPKNQELDKREWKFEKLDSNDREVYSSMIEGKDLILLYKESITKAFEWNNLVKGYNGVDLGTGSLGTRIGNSQNVLLFNRDLYPSKQVITRFSLDVKKLIL